MQVFKENIEIGRVRPDGSPGFIKLLKGSTPESYDLTPDEMASIESQLKEDGKKRVTATVTMTEAEVIKQASIQDRIAFVILDMVKLDPEKKKKALWTDEDLPRVRYIENELKTDITEDQRDEAWSKFQEEV